MHDELATSEKVAHPSANNPASDVTLEPDHLGARGHSGAPLGSRSRERDRMAHIVGLRVVKRHRSGDRSLVEAGSDLSHFRIRQRPRTRHHPAIGAHPREEVIEGYSRADIAALPALVSNGEEEGNRTHEVRRDAVDE